MFRYSIILCLLIKVLRSSCEGTISLTFVIDDTKSMWNDIEQVKTQVDQIMDVALEEKSSEIKEFVLVSFNDPVVTLLDKTSDRVSFRRSVYSLWAHNNINPDCPEMAMGGIIRGLEESRPGSYVFVFTDASAKDYMNYTQVIDLCQSKQSQVVFVLTGDCGVPGSQKVAVYYTIAAACSGQVFKINKDEVTTMIEVIRKKIGGKSNILTSRVIPPLEQTNIPFTVDEKVKSVLITTSGTNVELSVRSPSRDVIKKILMWTNDSKAIELTNLVSGSYSAMVLGFSYTSILVTGRTDFSFQHGFSIILPRAPSQTYTQPIAGENNFLSVTVVDPDDDVTIEAAQILDMNDNVLIELPLNRVQGNFYTTDEFSSPTNMIKIAVIGKLKHNGQTVRRISKTPVQPKIRTIRPVIDKSLTQIETTDASTVKILCKVLAAKPKPTISWYFKTVSSPSYNPLPVTGDELIVNIDHASVSGAYICVAENEAGRDEHVTELIVTLKPKVLIDKGSRISVKYGSTISVKCFVTAKPTPKVEWRDSNNKIMPVHTQIHQSHKGNTYFEYTSTMTLNNIKHSGKYYCHSSNSRGSTVEMVDVTVLSPFQRHGEQEETLSLGYGKSYTIPCKVESELPVKVKWYFTPDNGGSMETLKPSDKYFVSSNGSALIIKYMDLELRGKYRCSVTLAADENENQSYNVNLNIYDLIAPKLEASVNALNVRENASATISIKILKGIPKPTVSWYFKSKQMDTFRKLSSVGEQLHIVNAMLEDAGIYKCIATNVVGSNEVSSELIVAAPPRINNNVKIFKGLIGDVALRIPCNVTGYPKPDITWSDRDEGENIAKGQKYDIEEDGALIIKDPVVADTKAYWCTAKNSLGTDKEFFNGSVTEDIEYENVHEVYILQGATEKIKCLLPHTATDSVRWYKNGNLMDVTGSYVHFINATVFMDGNYTCRVSNNFGSKSDTILVDVGYIPKFTIFTDTKITDWKGEGDLNCGVSAKPTATAEWFHSGELLESARDHFQLDIFDWGEYSCRIKNVHGSIVRTFSVASEGCLVNRDDESVTDTPVILSELSTWPDYTITNQYVNFNSGEKFKLLCPNTTSAFKKFPAKNEIDVTCDHENKFLFDGKSYKYSDFHCDRQVMPVIKKTGNRCLAENSETIRVGFSGKTFIEAYEVCLDTHENLPLYARMTLTTTRYEANKSDLKWLRTEIENARQDSVFTCNSHSASSCYTKGQLVNATDVSFGPMQTSTYVDQLNSVPIWLPSDDRTTWSEIEEVVRKRLNIETTLSVWSGASKYTQKNEGKIPRYLWKVVKSSEELIAVVYVNEENPKEDDIFCKNICDGDAMLWLIPKDKFAYCCTLEDFLVAFSLPKKIFD